MATAPGTVSSELSRSLLRQFAERRVYTQSLSEGLEIDMLRLLDVLERTRQKWDDALRREQSARERLQTAEENIESLRQENQLSNAQLRDARAQIASLMSEKQNMQMDIDEMEHKFELVSELLKEDIVHLKDEDQRKLAFLKDPPKARVGRESSMQYGVKRKTNGSEEEIDYDRTDDSLDPPSNEDSNDDDVHLRNGRPFRRAQMAVGGHPATKRSKSVNNQLDAVAEETETPVKRSKGSTNTDTMITTTTTVTMDPEGKVPTKAKVTVRRSMNRSMSESNILTEAEEQKAIESATAFNALTPRYTATSTMDLRTPLPSGRKWKGGTSIEKRPHNFAKVSCLVSSDKCDVCMRYVGIVGKASYKCSDCNVRVHKLCADRAPVPCVPRTPTPRTPNKQRPRLKDFCPPNPPMIPHLIIHCVIALERDRLSTEGIYRIPGHESEIAKLLNDFRSARFLPKLETIDTEVITGCIRRFLRELRDTLIPGTSWDEFVRAAECEDASALNSSIADLPMPNKHTLAYLCAHFIKVTENSTRNKMTREVMARCVGPTIVGSAPSRMATVGEGQEEARKQIIVMMALLSMPREYWMNFLHPPAERPLVPGTSEGRTLAPSSRQRHNDAVRMPPKTPLKAKHSGSSISPSAADHSLLGPVRTPPQGLTPHMIQPIPRKGRFFADPF